MECITITAHITGKSEDYVSSSWIYSISYIHVAMGEISTYMYMFIRLRSYADLYTGFGLASRAALVV